MLNTLKETMGDDWLESIQLRLAASCHRDSDVIADDLEKQSDSPLELPD